MIAPGTVVYVNLQPVHGREQTGTGRPCVTVSRQLGSMQVVVPLTSNPRMLPSRVPVVSDPRYGRESYAMCEQVRAVDVGRYDSAADGQVATGARISPDELAAVRTALVALLSGD